MAITLHRSTRSRRASAGGFSYVEVAISSFVLTVGILGSMAAFNVSSTLRETAEMELIASTRLSEAIEIVRERADSGDFEDLVRETRAALGGGPVPGAPFSAQQVMLKGPAALGSDVPTTPTSPGVSIPLGYADGTAVTGMDYEAPDSPVGAPIVVRFFVDENIVQPPVDLNGNGIAGDPAGVPIPGFPYTRVIVVASVAWKGVKGYRSLSYCTVVAPRKAISEEQGGGQ